MFRYDVICVSRQRVRRYLVFVTTQASLLVKKANEILITTNVEGSKKLPFTEAPSFLTSRILELKFSTSRADDRHDSPYTILPFTHSSYCACVVVSAEGLHFSAFNRVSLSIQRQSQMDLYTHFYRAGLLTNRFSL